MVLSPRWAEAATLITPEVRALASIGLHLDFTLFGTSDSHSYSHPTLIARSVLRSLSKTAIEANIHAQLNAFEQTLYTPPDYIDGHQHVHQLPQIRDGLLNVLTQRYAGQLPWIRVSKPPLSAGVKGMIIRLLGSRELAQQARLQGLNCSGDLLGVYDFNDAHISYSQRLSAWFASAKESYTTPALMCHPAVFDENAHTNDAIYPARVQEFEALKLLKPMLEANNLMLVKKPINSA